MTSQCGLNITHTLGCASCANFFGSYHILISSVITEQRHGSMKFLAVCSFDVHEDMGNNIIP